MLFRFESRERQVRLVSNIAAKFRTTVFDTLKTLEEGWTICLSNFFHDRPTTKPLI